MIIDRQNVRQLAVIQLSALFRNIMLKHHGDLLFELSLFYGN